MSLIRKPLRTVGEYYRDAEDAADPADAGASSVPRPSEYRGSRAVRLIDLEENPPAQRARRGRGAPPRAGGRPRGETMTSALEKRVAPASDSCRPSVGSDACTEPSSETAISGHHACSVLSICPGGEGESVIVTLALPPAVAEELLPPPPADRAAGTRGITRTKSRRNAVAMNQGLSQQTPNRDGRVRVRLHLLTEQYAERGVRVGTINPSEARELLEDGRFSAAVLRGLRLLQYGDQSARRLAFKLSAKGCDREVAAAAAAYLADKGYIREDDTARRRVEASLRKSWGPRRIREDLRANGFSADAVDEALESIADVDFEAACYELVCRKYTPLPDDRAGRDKIIAALIRLGYDAENARAALRRAAKQSSCDRDG